MIMFGTTTKQTLSSASNSPFESFVIRTMSDVWWIDCVVKREIETHGRSMKCAMEFPAAKNLDLHIQIASEIRNGAWGGRSVSDV